MSEYEITKWIFLRKDILWPSIDEIYEIKWFEIHIIGQHTHKTKHHKYIEFDYNVYILFV